jgi:hypothetical protein
VERRVLRILQDDRATITALAQQRWDAIKDMRAATRLTADDSSGGDL